MEYFFGLLPWLFVYIVGIINLRYNSQRSNNYFYFILFLFSALRYDVGFDYLGYEELIVSGNEHAVNRIEPIERFFVLLCRKAFTQLFFVINSFITVYFTKWALERSSSNLAISGIVFLCFPEMFANSMNIIRFWSALSLIFYGSTWLNEKKIYIFLICLIMALGFHNSAIIGILYIPLYYFKIPNWLNVSFLIMCFIGGEYILAPLLTGILPENLYTDQFLRYASLDHQAEGMSKIPYVFLIIDIIFLIGHRKFKSISNNSSIYISIYNIGVSLMFLLSFQTTLASRISRPFIVYLLILMPLLISKHNLFNIPITYRSKLILLAIISFLLMLYLITITNASIGKSQFIPYKIFLL